MEHGSIYRVDQNYVQSLDLVYKKAQKFINVEKESRLLRTLVCRPLNKSNDIGNMDNRESKPFVDRHPNLPHLSRV